jgi:phosphoribosyl 1,2-cyclic phosphodiesterase
MSLALSILASGSSGNCSVVRSRGGTLLLDCGIGPRAASTRMKHLGVGLDDLSAICLTHIDSDHFNPNWVQTILRRKIFLYCHESHVDEVYACAKNRGLRGFLRTFNGQTFCPVAGLHFRSIRLPHDRLGSYAFVLEGHGGRIGYATDLGQPDMELIQRFEDLNVLAIESNYDPHLQETSPRPAFLKRRITGGRGHLSNQQAFETVRHILDRAQDRRRPLPRHIVLLHRSRQCNCPTIVRNLFGGDGRIAPRLVLAEQDWATSWLWARDEPSPQKQLELQWEEEKSIHGIA